MGKWETLVVPEELGAWLGYQELGNPDYYFSTIEELLQYWSIDALDLPSNDFIAENKKELIEVILGSREYKVEEPKYCALIKGHELIKDESDWTPKYWNYDTTRGDTFPSNNKFLGNSRYFTKMSKSEWNEIGINEDNADFVKVEEMEEWV